MCVNMGTGVHHTMANGEWSIGQGGLWFLASESVSQGWGQSGLVHSNLTPYIVIPAAWVMHREQLAVPIKA